MIQHTNPYMVLSETISLENVQTMGELITLKCLRGFSTYSQKILQHLYVNYVQDLNRRNNPKHTFSDAYDLAQTATCFLCRFIGKKLTDVYAVKNGKIITIKQATYTLVSKHVGRLRAHQQRSRDIDYFTETFTVEIDSYQEQDYTEVDYKITLLNLGASERVVLDCFMAGMGGTEIAELLDINRSTVWRRRNKIQAKYKSLFHIF